MIQDVMEHQEKARKLSCFEFSEMGCIKVEIGLEVDVPTLLTYIVDVLECSLACHSNFEDLMLC
jgi:hypothetical protein